ncbi:MAG: helix-turn-helix domain-containing protein [Eubacteriales bacterium]|nr:helix-turn-helix domain-containing protein [Eubacteriales bacterium]
MPRDKTASHEKIVQAAMQEFQQKGFERASMKAVADAVGMTSAALYRHFAGKQDMFAALVQPAIDAMDAWQAKHMAASYDGLERHASEATWEMWDFDGETSDVRMVLDVMYEQPETFRLLLCCAAGTPYEHYAHDMIEQSVDEMMRFLQACRARGIPAREIQRDEMHMLVSAYCTALIQPIEHGYDKADAERYLKTMVDFFTPGWRMITGL